MGSRHSKASEPVAIPSDNGQVQARAIARGRVYVVVNYPAAVESLKHTQFSDGSFVELLAALQKSVPDFEVTLEAGRMERFSQHATFYNSSDPEKFNFKPRVLVEVFYTGVYAGVPKEMIKRTVAQTLDPSDECHLDLRSEMGRYHTTPHLETLLRI